MWLLRVPIIYAFTRSEHCNVHCNALIGLRKRQIICPGENENWEEFNPSHLETFQCSMPFLYRDEQEHFVVCSPSGASRWLVGRERDCKPSSTTFDEYRLTSIFLKCHQGPLSMFAVSLLNISQKQCSYDTSMSAERIISNTAAAPLAGNNIPGELEGEKDPYLH